MRRPMLLVLALLVGAVLPVRKAEAQTQKEEAPSGRVMGTVADTSGMPLLGAQVVVVGPNRMTIAGGSGAYAIGSVPPGKYTVRVSSIGYADGQQEVEVAAGETATANFRLVPQAIVLAQIVTVGYGTQRRRDVTGAVASVRSAEIQQIAKSNAVEALKGRMAGVDVVTTGYKPGDGMQIRVRGARSLEASNEPLFVLDGIPIAGGINDINPLDIESIEVLKDASATAIYGSRAANGVVLIQTKKGLAGRTRIIYDTYIGAQSPLRRVRMMNAEEYAQLKRESFRTIGKYKCPAEAVRCEEGDRELFTEPELAQLVAGTSTDWQDLVLRTGAQMSHQLSITGGNERTQFAVSGNLLHQDGIVRGQDFKRRTMRVNFEHQALPRLRFGASALVTRSDQNLGRGDGVYDEALRNVPTGPAFDSAGNYIFKPIPDGQRVNPLADIANHLEENTRTRAFGTLFASVNLAQGLDWRVNFGPDLTFARNGRYRGPETQAKQGSSADARMQEDRTYAFTLDNILTYQRPLGADHRIDGTLLYSMQRQRDEDHDSEASGLPYEHQRWYNLGSGATIESVRSELQEWSLQSYMGRVNYALKDRYLLTLTARLDGSSRLAEGKKYSLFPSVAVGWQLRDEPFLRELSWLSNLKLRASYGRAGNTSVNPYQTQGGLSRTTYSFGGNGSFGYRPSTLPNPDLEWEKTDQVDVGLEFGVLQNRLSGTIDFYRAYTRDLLMERQLPPNTGFDNIIQNIGETRNTGLEIALSGKLLDGWHGLRWSTDLTWATNRSEIVKLYGGEVDDIGNRWFIGQPIDRGTNQDEERVWYDYKFLGIWQWSDSAEAAKYRQLPGQIRVQDRGASEPDGDCNFTGGPDGLINACDQMIIGHTYPKWTASLSTRLEWKNFDLSAMAITRQDYLVQNTFLTTQSQLFGRYNNLKVDYWLPTNPSNTEPRPNADQEFPIYGGTRAYQDGSFVKIRHITLGYTLPAAWANRLQAQSLRIYGTAQDPFMFTNFVGLDPEGRNGAGTPSYRTLTIGLTLGL